MKTLQFFSLPSALLASLLFPLGAQASVDEPQQTEHLWSQGWYIGGQFGLATTNVSNTGLDELYDQAGIDASTTKIDDSGASYSLFLGYKFNPYFSVEGGYIDLGKRSVEFSGQAIDLDAFYDLAEHVYPETGDGWSLSVLGTYPLSERFSVTGKLGYFAWELDAVTSSIASETTQVGADSHSGSGVWLGAELGYQINHDLQAYVSYQHMPLDADEVGVFALGLRYWFGTDASDPAPVLPAAVTPIVAQIDSDNDGVFNAQDQCSDTPNTHAVDSKGCTVFAPRVAEMELTILYENNSDQISHSDMAKIQQLADFINKYDVQEITVFGHTSASGPQAYNQKLSERRAASVAAMLSAEFNIENDIIKAVGKGESEPVSDIPEQNRRIEVYLNEELNLPVLKK